MKTKTVFIAEDEPLARETLRNWVVAHPQLQLIGEAADGASALPSSIRRTCQKEAHVVAT